MRLLFLSLALLFGCADERPRWERRPVQYLIDDSMSAECATAARQGLAFWQDAGVSYLRPRAAPVPARMVPGAITVTAGTLPGESVGQCRTRVSADFEILAARIVLEDCDVIVASHELGHALGLDHSDDWRNVMFPYAVGTTTNEEQREHVK